VLASPISHGPVPDQAEPRVLRVFPSSRYLQAFDAVISAVGYNSFHELMYAGVPSLLVPNEHPMMDDQAARAEHAQRMGWALALRVADVYGLDEQLDRLLDPAERAAMREAMALLPPRNGAADAARILHEMALTMRADRAG
jgi:UDP:flavonoid glycosyltransferase YjiC (YdhE family)